MKEKTLIPPKPELPPGGSPVPEAGERGEVAPSPRIAGFILIAAGILLMLLSGWAPIPSGFGVWENVSSGGSSAESPAIAPRAAGDDDLYGGAGSDTDLIEAKDGSKGHTSCGSGERQRARAKRP